MTSYASLDSTEHIIICDHDTITSTSLTEAEAMEVEEFMNLIKSEEYMDLPKLVPIISTNELQSRIVSNCNIVVNKGTCALSSALNPESPPLEVKEDAILTRRRVAEKNNSDSTDESEDDKKPLDYQSTKNRICPFVPRCKVKKMLYMCIILVFLYLTFIFQYTASFHKNHKDNNTSIVGEWKKEILDLDEIVQFLAEYLQQDSPLLKVVALIGGTKSDKSYTVDIIKNRLRRRRKSNNFSPLYSDLIVLKNLRNERSIKFTKCVINFVKRYRKEYGDQRLTILTAFKVEQMDDESAPSVDLHRTINTVKDAFLEENINIKIIPYEPLNEETLEKYIINTAENIRLTLSQDQIDVIKRRLMEDTDWRLYSNVGFDITICD